MKNTHQVLLIIFLCLSFISYRWITFPNTDKNLKKFENKKVTLCGSVAGEPVVKISGTKFVLKTGGVECEGDSYIEVRVKNMLDGLSDGQRVRVEGRVTLPENIVDENGRIFDYVGYLKKEKIYYQVQQAKVVEMGERQVNMFTILYVIKNKIISSIEKNLPTPHSLLASGLIISGKGSMSKELQTEFQRVGLIHIVVLSGSNVSIIGEVIFKIFSFLPKTLGALLGSFGVVLFSFMVGSSSTVVRSTLMSLIGIYARISGRTNSAIISLLVAGILMLMWNPLLLVYDPSFQLSFLASLGLILYATRVESFIKKIMSVLKIKETNSKLSLTFLEIVSSSLGTQIATLPFILKMSGMVSIVSLPVNILLLPVIPYTMLMTFVTSVTGFISPFLTVIPAYVSWIFLEVILKTVHYFSSMDFAVYEFGVVNSKIIYLLYILLIVEYWLYLRKRKTGFSI